MSQNSDDPFALGDATILRPRPRRRSSAGRASDAPSEQTRASASPPPAVHPAASSSAQADIPGGSTNPLLHAAVPLLALAAELRDRSSSADIEALRQHATQEIRSFRRSAAPGRCAGRRCARRALRPLHRHRRGGAQHALGCSQQLGGAIAARHLPSRIRRRREVLPDPRSGDARGNPVRRVARSAACVSRARLRRALPARGARARQARGDQAERLSSRLRVCAARSKPICRPTGAGWKTGATPSCDSCRYGS